MGFSIKSISNTVKKAVSKPGNVLKKAAVVATSAGAGFVAGGPAGAAAGAVAGAVKASKTGKAPALNLRTGYQTVAVGAASGLVAGVAAKGVASAAKGGVMNTIKGIGSSVVKYGKSGGVSTTLLSAGKTFFSKGGSTTEPAESSPTAEDSGTFGGGFSAAVERGVGGLLEKGKKALATPAGQEILKSVKGKVRQAGILGQDQGEAPPNPLTQAGMFGALPVWVPALLLVVMALFAFKRK